MNAKNNQMGSSFDDFLREEGVHEETQSIAIKRVLAWQLSEAMARQGVNKCQMATKMNTSRSQLDRILDPNNDRIQFDTIIKAAHTLGRKVRIELI